MQYHNSHMPGYTIDFCLSVGNQFAKVHYEHLEREKRGKKKDQTNRNNRMIKSSELEGAFIDGLVPLPALNRDTHISVSAQSPSADLGCLQGWAPPPLWAAHAVLHYSYLKNKSIFPYIQSKSPLF